MSPDARYVRRYWFGVDEEEAVGETVLLMERDRLDQYQAALDRTERRFEGVFRGITGVRAGKRLTVIYSIGPAHIADCVGFLVEGFGARHLLATGSIGGLATEMGDIVLTSKCATQDGYSLTVFGDEVESDVCLGRFVNIDRPAGVGISDGNRETLRGSFGCNVRTGKVFTVPAVSMESRERLERIRQLGFVALDLETGPFLASCRRYNVTGACVHWVTDLPLERDFYYQYYGDAGAIHADQTKKHRQWLNMPRLILPIVDELVARW